MGLLQDIQTAATNSDRSVTDLLRLAIVLGRRLRHQPLTDWAHRELEGYVDHSEEVPTYRRLRNATLIGQFLGPFGAAVKNSPIPTDVLPREIRDLVKSMPLVEPIASYEDGAKGEGNLSMPLPQIVSIFGVMNIEYWRGYTLAEAELRFSRGVIQGVIDAVRTRLLEFALEIESLNPKAGEAPSVGPPPVDPPMVQQVFDSTIIYGGTVVSNRSSKVSTVVSGSKNVQVAQGDRVKQRQSVVSTTGLSGDEFLRAIEAVRTEIDANIPEESERAEAQSLLSELENRGLSGAVSPVVRAVYEALMRFGGDHPALANALTVLGTVLGYSAVTA